MPKFIAILSSFLTLATYAEIHPEYFKQCDATVNKYVAEKKLPGAVLLIDQGDKTVYLKAFGHRALEPKPEPMTTDTIFDLASLSKSVSTAPCVMILMERGKIDVHEKVSHYLPHFGNHGKEVITVEDLLLHHSGLIPDNPVEDFKSGREAGFKAIDESKPAWKPETHFRYSDVNYITLGRIVEVVSGESLDKFAEENLFKPLGMNDTTYNPPKDWQPRIAPTEKRDKHWMRGEVHDPRAYAMGGVAGHAGVFSTAEDLAKFCRMILHGGELDGHRVMSEETVKIWTAMHEFDSGDGKGDTVTRTYGFDAISPYDGPLGTRFPRGKSFGHTGFTGTAFWIDPGDQCFYILLANSVHPTGTPKGFLGLRREIGTLAGETLLGPAPKQ